MNEGTVESALQILRPGLEADKFDLRLGAISPSGDIQVILEAKEGACLDCLVPADLMIQMIDTVIREKDDSLGQVTLVKVGFDELTGH